MIFGFKGNAEFKFLHHVEDEAMFGFWVAVAVENTAEFWAGEDAFVLGHEVVVI